MRVVYLPIHAGKLCFGPVPHPPLKLKATQRKTPEKNTRYSENTSLVTLNAMEKGAYGGAWL